MLERIVRLVLSLIAIYLVCLIILHFKQEILGTINEMRDFIISIFNSVFYR